MRDKRILSLFGILAASIYAGAATATASAAPLPDSPSDSTSSVDIPAESSSVISGANARYGPFGWLDRRSRYGQGWFPEPLRVDESDVDNELRLDWEHDEGKGSVSNSLTAEVEKSFGLLTLEIEVPYELSESGGYDPISRRTLRQHEQGVGNIDVGARIPVYQYVSRDGTFDNTIGVAAEVGIPTNSPVSKHTELVPKLFDDLRLGEHLSVQGIVGLSYLLGSRPEGGTRTLEYGIDFGYALEHDELPIPHIERTIPIFELVGELPLNGEDAGQHSLTATIGVRLNMESIGAFQPRLGLGYVFPIDKGGREELSRGFVTSLVFEY